MARSYLNVIAGKGRRVGKGIYVSLLVENTWKGEKEIKKRKGLNKIIVGTTGQETDNKRKASKIHEGNSEKRKEKKNKSQSLKKRIE